MQVVLRKLGGRRFVRARAYELRRRGDDRVPVCTSERSVNAPLLSTDALLVFCNQRPRHNSRRQCEYEVRACLNLTLG